MLLRGNEVSAFTQVLPLGRMGLLRAEFHTHSFVPHRHSTFALGVIEEGAAVTQHRGVRHVVPAGSVLSVNPDEVHTGAPLTSATGWRYRMMYPDPVVVQRIASECIGKPVSEVIFPAPVIVDARLRRSLLRLFTALERPDSLLQKETLFYQALGLLIERHARLAAPALGTGREPAAVVRIKEYLASRIARGVRLSELAALVSLSPFHVIRIFRQATGLPPYAYFEQLRVERAVELVRRGAPISQVAAMTGFSDQSHLTRRFKRVMGVSPGEYARSTVGGQQPASNSRHPSR